MGMSDDTRIRPDSRAMSRTVTSLMAALGLTAFVAGVPGLVWGAGLAGLPTRLAWTAPVLLDIGLIVFALSAVVRRSRSEAAAFSWACLGALTIMSSAVQVAHVVSTTGAATSIELGVAFVLGALPPVTVFAASHAWLDLAVGASVARGGRARPVRRAVPASKPRAARVEVGAPVVTVPVEVKPAMAVRRMTAGALDVVEVRRLAVVEGLSQRAIADVLGTSKSSVARALATAPLDGEASAA